MARITTGTSHQSVESFPSSQGDRGSSAPSDQVSRQQSCRQRESDRAFVETLDDCGCRWKSSLGIFSDILPSFEPVVEGLDSCLPHYIHNWLKICKQEDHAASRRLTMSWMALSAL